MVFELEAALHVPVKLSAVSAVRSTVTAAGVIWLAALPINDMPGAAVADPTAGVVKPEPSIHQPMQNTVPLDPLLRVWMVASTHQIALVIPLPPVIVVD